MKTPQAYAEEYFERVAIKIENGTIESLAQMQARQEVFAYAKCDEQELVDAIRKITKENKLN